MCVFCSTQVVNRFIFLGISQSRVPVPHGDIDSRRKRKESKKDAIEIHKFLYETQTVFPPKEIQTASTSKEFTLPAGSHVYDFSLVIPDNVGCESIKQAGSLSLSRLVIDSSGIDYARAASAHFAGPLPPSLSDMENIASVRYFLKATVSRTSFLKMNIRVFKPIVLLPPDQPYQGNPREVLFVRRDVTIGQGPPQDLSSSDLDGRRGRRKGKGTGGFMYFLNGGGSLSSPLSGSGGPTANITFEMRYPGSAAFVPVKPELPFKLYAISTTNPANFKLGGPMKLQDLLIKLYATTSTRAQEFQKEATHSLTLFETHNLNVTLDWSTAKHISNPQYGERWEIEFSSALWEKVVIPDFVPPSFTTCNIKRRYTFEVIGGFASTSNSPSQLVSLITNVTVMSGLSKKSNPVVPARREKDPPPPADAHANEAAPPSYTTVVYEDEYGGNTSAAAQAQQEHLAAGSSSSPVYADERRAFGQAPGYYENLESLDNEKS